MIDFLRRGLKFSLFITHRWVRSAVLAIRGKFFVWLHINLCIEGPARLSLQESQELSRSFSCTLLRLESDFRASQIPAEPGIFLLAEISNHSIRLRLPNAALLRLLTPRSDRLVLMLNAASGVLVVQDLSAITRGWSNVTGPASSHFEQLIRKSQCIGRDLKEFVLNLLSANLVSLQAKKR